MTGNRAVRTYDLNKISFRNGLCSEKMYSCYSTDEQLYNMLAIYSQYHKCLAISSLYLSLKPHPLYRS